MKEIHLTCIGCPMGCALTAEMEGKTVISVTGNGCGIGDRYARKELVSPERMVTTTVAVSGGEAPVVSVRTEGQIPRDRVFDCVRALKHVRAAAPVRIGQVIADNLCGMGIRVVATKSVEKEN